MLSHAKLHEHAYAAKTALDKLRRLSAVTMAGSAMLMLVMQGILSLLQPAEVSTFFNRLVLGIACTSIVAAWLWLTTAHRFWMVSGAILLQTAAALFFFVVMGVEQQLDVFRLVPVRWTLFVAVIPIAGALLAWHQFRSYGQLLKLERAKAKDCQVPST